MSAENFILYRASAGSGKTYTLVREFLTLCLSSDNLTYGNILAVTFTNKATEEMKSRILKELHILATNPAASGYYKEFIPSSYPDDASLQKAAETVLCNILHDYSAFAVSTIDRFFQQTLKAFSREIGHFASYQIELDRSSLIAESVDRVLDSITGDKKDEKKEDPSFIKLLINAPSTFWTVGLVQFFCWAAFLFMWTYSNGAIASQCFGWDGLSTAAGAFQDAGNWVGVCFAVQAVGSMLWALFIPTLEKLFHNKGAYIVSLLVGAVGFASTMFVTNQYVLLLSYALIGAAWAAMLAVPFTILTNSLKGDNMGYYLGLFNCTICLPQIVAALVGGKILDGVCAGSQVGMLVAAGVLLVLGAASVLLIKEGKK